MPEGGFKIADGFVEITGNTDKVRGAVQELPAKVSGDADSAGRSIGSRISAGLFAGMGDGAKSGGLIATVLGTMATKAAVFATAGLGAVAIAQQLVGVLGLLPALGFAGAAVLGTLVIGLDGFGNALKNMGDPAKFNEALKALSPNAREAALAVNELRPAYAGLKTLVQDNLFTGMAQSIKEIGTSYLPVLTTGLGGTATSLNALIREFAGFATAPTTIASVNTMFSNTKGFLDALAPAVRPFLQALTTIGEVGSSFLPQIGTWLTGLAQKFGAFITEAAKTGQLQSWIQGGLTALSQLWTIVTNLWTSVTNLASVFGGGAGLLGALTAISGVIATVTGFIRENATVVGLLAAAYAAVVIGMKAYAIGLAIGGAAVKAYTAVQAALNVVMALNPFGLVVIAIVAVIAAIALLIANWDTVKAFLITCWEAIKTAATTTWTAISTFFSGLWTSITSAVTTAWNGIGTFFSGLWTGIQTGAITAWNAIVAFLTGIWNGIVSAATTIWTTLTTATSTAWNAVKSAVETAINAVKSTVTSVFNAVVSFLAGVWENIKSAATAAWNAVKDAVTTAVNAVKSTVDSIINAVLQFLSSSWEKAKQVTQTAWTGLVNAVKTTANDMLNFVKGIPQAIVSGLGNLGNLLFNAGKAIIQGMINGIKSMAQAAVNAVQGVLQRARDLLPSSPAKEGPFSGKGWTLYSGQSMVEGLATGVRSRRSQLSGALSSVLGSARDQVGGLGSLRASGGRSGAGGGPSGGALPAGLTAALERLSRNAGLTVNVIQQSGSPAETGRFVALALRTVG